jgi:membrane-associated phospholipid phosphatase
MNKDGSPSGKRKTWLQIFTLEFFILLLLLLAMIVFIYAARLVFIKKEYAFDEAAFNILTPYITPARTSFMSVITLLGKHTLLIPFNILLLIYFLYKKRKWFAIRIAALALSSLLLELILKQTFQRERPAIPVIKKVSGFSFPSGHALIGVVFYGLLIYVIWKEVKQRWLRLVITFLIIALVLIISFSRVYLRVHYASDVIAGLCVGFIWLVFSLKIISNIEKRYIARRALIKEGLNP